ncbi:CYTH domain-containing protein [Mannheimia indoligenes]|uniref:CYTH domain-containing protein n=1 Tax=Mannheimia indoligenes TaxID=3103145 RepID=UPI002FE581B2
MENKNQAEIELKIMLEPHNISLIENWLNSVKAFELLEQKSQTLGNSYYDTPEQFFASQKMGLRVRSQNHQFEITLKTKGEIVGGLHIRPEYNLSLPTNQPDFLTLVEKFNLPFENAEQISNSLQTIFSTDFTRQIWLFKVGTSEIEVALDQGLIKNRYGKEAISELEFEIKQGNLSDLFNLVETMPKADGMWLSGLSKAQRGYLVGQAVKFEQEIANAMRQENSYQLEQKLADFIRVGNENKAVLERFNQCVNQKLETWEDSKAFVKSQGYLMANLAILKRI